MKSSYKRHVASTGKGMKAFGVFTSSALSFSVTFFSLFFKLGFLQEKTIQIQNSMEAGNILCASCAEEEDQHDCVNTHTSMIGQRLCLLSTLLQVYQDASKSRVSRGMPPLLAVRTASERKAFYTNRVCSLQSMFW